MTVADTLRWVLDAEDDSEEFTGRFKAFMEGAVVSLMESGLLNVYVSDDGDVKATSVIEGAPDGYGHIAVLVALK